MLYRAFVKLLKIRLVKMARYIIKRYATFEDNYAWFSRYTVEFFVSIDDTGTAAAEYKKWIK